MAFFRQSEPKSKDRTEVDVMRVDRDKRAARLAAAERLVAERCEDVRRLATSDDDAALSAAEYAQRAAQDRRATLQLALNEAEADLQAAVQRRRAAEEQRQRSETAAVMEATANDLDDLGRQFRELMNRFLPVSERASAISFEAMGLHNFVLRAKEEIPQTNEALAAQLRGLAVSTRNGNGPASLPEPAPTPQPSHRAIPAVTRMFVTKPLKWLDANGDLRIQPELFDADLPPDVAARAIELDAAVPIDHPRRRQMQGHGRVYRPDPDRCISLIPGDDGQPQPRPELVPGVVLEPMPVESAARHHVGTFGA